jgi:cell division protein FtsL
MTQFPNPQFVSSRRPSQGNWQRNQNTVSYKSLTKLGPVSHTVLVALMVATLGLIYLVQVTQTSNYGYTLSSLNTQKSDLESKKSDLEVQNARLESLKRVSESAAAQSMTAPAQTSYVQ